MAKKNKIRAELLSGTSVLEPFFCVDSENDVKKMFWAFFFSSFWAKRHQFPRLARQISPKNSFWIPSPGYPRRMMLAPNGFFHVKDVVLNLLLPPTKVSNARENLPCQACEVVPFCPKWTKKNKKVAQNIFLTSFSESTQKNGSRTLVPLKSSANSGF